MVNIMVFGVYCRKSVISDKGESVENQLKMCIDYINNKFGEDNVIEIYEDEGYSGKNTARPMFLKLTEDIKKHKLDYVVCYRLDRMSRSVSDFSAMVEMMNGCKTGFICIKEEFDTSKPMGKAMMYIASVFSQLERETIGERVRDNMLLLAKDGRWLGGNTPLGYDSIREKYENNDGKVKYYSRLNENDQLNTVIEIFKNYIESESFSTTAKHINYLGYTTKNGNKFTPTAIKDILINPVYCKADETAFRYFENKGKSVFGKISDFGLMVYNKEEGKDGAVISVGRHMPAVDGKIWTDVQRIIEDRTYLNNRGIEYGISLASGAIVCGRCGEKMYAVKRSGGNNFDYICKNKRKYKNCECKNLNGIKADEIIKKYLKSGELVQMKKEVRERLLIKWTGEKLEIKQK